MSETQASTKIEDLPDNVQETTEIVQQLDNIISDVESDNGTEGELITETVEEPKDLEKPSKLLEYIQDSLVVFVLILLGTNSYSVDIFSKLPFLRNYSTSSHLFSALVALVIAISFFVVKYIINELQ